jgi:hypothetical protein
MAFTKTGLKSWRGISIEFRGPMWPDINAKLQ